MTDLRQHFTREASGKYKCRYCGHELAAGVSPTGLRDHLIGVPNSSTNQCPGVPDDVRASLFEINKRQRTASGFVPTSVQGYNTNSEPGQTSGNIGFQACEIEKELDIEDLDEDEMVKAIEAVEAEALLSMPVGDAFKKNKETILSWLKDDRVSRVGIWGMGGVGKTSLMRHIKARLDVERSLKTFWITVTRDFNISRLQNMIANKIGLTFSDDEDRVVRAGQLSRSLKAKGKCVLILDDIWDEFDVNDVGIPVGAGVCKLVLTSRLLPVCEQMEEIIELKALSKEESWVLFTRELGDYSASVEELARAVCMECAGLPLGIKVMARSMKRLSSVHTWSSRLNDFRESRVSKSHKMEEEVFSVLKFSYLHLSDKALQECLAYCALFPEDTKIKRKELIESMIAEGIIEIRRSRRAEFDKGHTMLDTLEKASLLEGDSRSVWMHDLIRDMVILELGSRVLVEAGAQLTQLPDVEKWTKDLVRVSLMRNNIERIPFGHTRGCPNLSTMLLCQNSTLKEMENSLFEEFQSLRILDLTWCSQIKKLPDSISYLVNLTALLVRRCGKLIHVPSLEQLKKLKKLDFKGCKKLKELPAGVKHLCNLLYFNLSSTGIEELESGILTMLVRLQFLKLCNKHGHSKLFVKGREVRELKKLETLFCKFRDMVEFSQYREHSQPLPANYSIFINEDNMGTIIYGDLKPKSRRMVSLREVQLSIAHQALLPTDIEELRIGSNSDIILLLDHTLLPSLLNLERISVELLKKAEQIFGENPGRISSSIPSQSLINLKVISIRKCKKLKNLFPSSLLANLYNLQKISVVHCHAMEHIFATKDEEGQESLSAVSRLIMRKLTAPPEPLHLPRLTTLELRDLPALTSIYNGTITGDSLQQLDLVALPNLRRITLALPQPSLEAILVDQEWWNSVEWGTADEKKSAGRENSGSR